MRTTIDDHERDGEPRLRRDRRAELRLVPVHPETMTEATVEAPTTTARLRVLGLADLPTTAQSTPRREPLRRDRRPSATVVSPAGLLFDADFVAARQERERREVAMLAEKLQAFADRLAREAG